MNLLIFKGLKIKKKQMFQIICLSLILKPIIQLIISVFLLLFSFFVFNKINSMQIIMMCTSYQITLLFTNRKIKRKILLKLTNILIDIAKANNKDIDDAYKYISNLVL